MILTDREWEKLRQIERDLADDDPRLARLLGAAVGWHRARHVQMWFILLLAMLLAALGISLGLAL